MQAAEMGLYDSLECQMSDLSHGNHEATFLFYLDELERHPATPRLASFPQIIMQILMQMH